MATLAEARLIRIRPWTEADAASLAAVYSVNSDELHTTEPWRPADFYTAAGQRRRIAEALSRLDMLHFVILEDTTLVGTIGFEQLSRGARTADLGYWVDRAHRGRGIASQAIALAVEYARSTLGLDRLRANVLPENIASQRLVEHNGFRLVGRHSPSSPGRAADYLIFERAIR